jgi:hypothetical protein
MFSIIDDTTEIGKLCRELEEKGIDMTEDEQCKVLLAWLGENEAAFENKVDGYVSVIREYKAHQQAAKDEAKRMQDRAKSHGAQVDRLKDVLVYAMETLGLEKKKTALNTITLAKAASINYSVNENLLPEKFIRKSISADKKAIQSALKSGEEIAGVEILESKKSLRIR